MPVYRLDEELWFPDPYLGEEMGLIAVGGDLSPERLTLAYSYGFFPWFDFKKWKEPVWYCPLERFVIFPDEIHISHSMRTMMNKKEYEVTFNKAFDRVIDECSQVDDRDHEEGAWIGPAVKKAYKEMHRLGLAESVEVWQKFEADDGEEYSALVGGLYGIAMPTGFFGESMFSLVPSASKLALIHLARRAKEKGWRLIDCQYETAHLKTMGGRHISYEEYLKKIRN